MQELAGIHTASRAGRVEDRDGLYEDARRGTPDAPRRYGPDRADNDP